jgi:hypothetical protein
MRKDILLSIQASDCYLWVRATYGITEALHTDMSALRNPRTDARILVCATTTSYKPNVVPSLYRYVFQ